jgi:hypothetical protein
MSTAAMAESSQEEANKRRIVEGRGNGRDE